VCEPLSLSLTTLRAIFGLVFVVHRLNYDSEKPGFIQENSLRGSESWHVTMAGGKTKQTMTVVEEDVEVKEDFAPGLAPAPAASIDNTYTTQLIDIKPVYLLDRAGWMEFKRALNECGLIWNIPHWMTTIVYKGTEWNEQIAKGVDLSTYFVDDRKSHIDGKEVGTSELGAKLIAGLGLPKNMGDYIQPGLRFCVLNTVEFESERKLPARQKLWNWLLKCLRGPKTTVGPYYYLIDEVKPYDISYLFKRLCQVLEQITICSLDDELETVIKMDYKPQTQNIFSYLVNLRKAIKRLHDLNERLPKDGQIWIPDSCVRSRLVRSKTSECLQTCVGCPSDSACGKMVISHCR
jgi:hypothetical protein